jgi:hypothetical protein
MMRQIQFAAQKKMFQTYFIFPKAFSTVFAVDHKNFKPILA